MLLAGQYGACAVFVGTMRDYNDGDRVCSMYLEHYPGMTEKQLESLVSASCKASFDACREIMEALKSTAPFWKKETLEDQNGERWVHRNTPGS